MCTDPLIKDYSTPLLFHPDLHKRNIFVSDADPGVVTAIIDWQGTAVEPAFWYRWDVPDFAGMKLVRPYQVLPGEKDDEQRERQQEPEQEQKQKRQQEGEEQEQEQENQDTKHNPLTAKAYTIQTLLTLPTLSTPKYIHENTFRPFLHPAQTWSTGLIDLEHELIGLRKDWTGLGFDGECPFLAPSEQELERHKEAYEMFKAVVLMRETVCEALGVGRGGFVPANGGGGDDGLWEERVGFTREFCATLTKGLEDDEEVEDV